MSNGFAKFISGKGFYLALALCLAGAGAAAWVAVDKTIDNIESAPLSETPQAETMHPEDQLDTHPAEQKIDNILQQTPESSDSVTAEANGDSSPSSQGQQEGILTAETPDDESSTDVLSSSVPSESVPESTESSEASTQPVQQQESDDFSLTLPVSGAAIAPFSGDMLVKNETLGDWRTHNGIDISAELGSAVTASSDGVVTDIRSDPLWGNVVEVTSGDYVMTYSGLSDDILVSVDMSVTAGDQIGSVGEIPCELSLEPHLHFDVKQNGEYVDPASLAK